MEKNCYDTAQPPIRKDILNAIRIKPAWSKSLDDILDEVLKVKNTEKVFPRRIHVWSYAAAILIPVLLVCHFYTVTKETAKGEHAVVQLPDHSTVTLNAESKISYKPCVWFISRKINLSGEACLEVRSGKNFTVHSGGNSVKVLGTTFNVYARPGVYRVTCLTGRIEVRAGGESVVLHSNMQAVFHEPKLSVNTDVASATVTGWIQGKFVFVKTPLHEVIAEIERQYNIKITRNFNPDYLYSGNFSKIESPEEILEVIGTPFDITFSIE